MSQRKPQLPFPPQLDPEEALNLWLERINTVLSSKSLTPITTEHMAVIAQHYFTYNKIAVAYCLADHASSKQSAVKLSRPSGLFLFVLI